MDQALSFLIKPASGSCNMRCEYCFYADEMRSRKKSIYGRMSQKTAETLVKKAFEADPPAVTFGFQGGEPMLMGIEFYKKFCELRDFYNRKKIPVSCTLQTNGTLMDESWADFFAAEGFLVGLSLDGTRSVNDCFRKDADGGGTFKKVLRAARLLEESKARFNILTVLTEKNAHDIERIYRFFISRGFFYQQYIPCLAPLEGETEPSQYTLTAKTYGMALRTLFDLWYEDFSAGKGVYIRYFENLAGIFAGIEPESCDMAGHCSKQYVAEADGSIYPCDFYVLDSYAIGNINEDSIEEIDEKRFRSGFIQRSEKLPGKCLSCRWIQICRGGCRRSRVFDETGSCRENSLCEAYEIFLPYAEKRIRNLAKQIRPRITV